MTLEEVLDRVQFWLRRRPVRVAEALAVVAVIVAYIVAPEAVASVVTLLVAIVGVVAGGEVAQTHTTSKHYPILPDGHEDEGHPDYDPNAP